MKLSSLLILTLAAASLCFGCSTERKPSAEVPPPASATPADEPQSVATLPAPQVNQVKEAIERIFRDAVVIDDHHAPAFIVGDFNGDLSQDIAVVLRPSPNKLTELNEELPAWILRDPFGHTEAKAPRLRIAANDLLLAIIHGYGAQGWRDPQATQTFLLKNAVASGMAAHPLKEFTVANQGKSLPSLRGDVIGETIDSKPGYLYYAGATYSWYDPKTFKGDSGPATAIHGRPTKLTKQ